MDAEYFLSDNGRKGEARENVFIWETKGMGRNWKEWEGKEWEREGKRRRVNEGKRNEREGKEKKESEGERGRKWCVMRVCQRMNAYERKGKRKECKRASPSPLPVKIFHMRML